MNNRTTERAFQLAGSGRLISVDDIKRRRRTEGYVTAQIDGKALHKQLRALIQAARASCAEAPTPEASAEYILITF